MKIMLPVLFLLSLLLSACLYEDIDTVDLTNDINENQTQVYEATVYIDHVTDEGDGTFSVSLPTLINLNSTGILILDIIYDDGTGFSVFADSVILKINFISFITDGNPVGWIFRIYYKADRND